MSGEDGDEEREESHYHCTNRASSQYKVLMEQLTQLHASSKRNINTKRLAREEFKDSLIHQVDADTLRSVFIINLI